MIKELCEHWSKKGVEKNFYTENDREIYCYGYQLLIESLMGFGLFGLIALIFDKGCEVAIFLISFIALRSIGGGVHAKKLWICLICSSGIIILVCFLSEWQFLMHHLWFLLIINTIAWYFAQRWIPQTNCMGHFHRQQILNLVYGLDLVIALCLMIFNNATLAEFILLSQFFWWTSALLGSKNRKI